MISSFRNFAKTKFAGILVFIMIIPFVFWGMGSMFSSGNTNTIAKINKINISTQEFIDYLNGSGIPENKIRENLDNNIIEDLLSGLVSTTLLDLEINDYNIIIPQNTLLKLIKVNKNFLDENGNFQRTKYEKFLLENNQSAPIFEQRVKKRELQKNLFDYIGAGTVSPDFLINKLYKEENTKLDIDFINLKAFYKKKETFTDEELKSFLNENKDQLKIEYLDFKYAIINPLNLVGIEDFDQTFFDKIDQIEIDIANGMMFENIIEDLDVSLINKKNFKFSSNASKIEKKIFESRKNDYDIFEIDNDYILYKIEKIDERIPDLNDSQIKDEVLGLISQKNNYEYNRQLLDKINNKKFDNNEFLKLGQNLIQNTKLDSIKDDKKFKTDSVKILYSLPEGSFTLISDEKNNIYLAKVKKIIKFPKISDDDQLIEYSNKQNSNVRRSMLQSYDLYLSNKYEVILNHKTIERVRNFFQ